MSVIIISDSTAEAADLAALAGAARIHDVLAFSHPAGALDWCGANVPDLVFVDFLMRATDGLEVIHRLRAMAALRDVPIVLMLPHGFEAVSARAWRYGATDFLAKPVDPSEFLARSRNLLALRALRRDSAEIISALRGVERNTGAPFSQVH